MYYHKNNIFGFILKFSIRIRNVRSRVHHLSFIPNSNHLHNVCFKNKFILLLLIFPLEGMFILISNSLALNWKIWSMAKILATCSLKNLMTSTTKFSDRYALKITSIKVLSINWISREISVLSKLWDCVRSKSESVLHLNLNVIVINVSMLWFP